MQAQEHSNADLLGIGKHCAWPSCGQLDFLPFRCACGQTFCLEHRTAAAHKCSVAAADCKQVIVCPICAQGVALTASDDPNLVFDRHQREGCDPSNYARVHKKPRCPVKGCKEKLTSINTYTCKSCRQAVCLRHRLAGDHMCQGSGSAAAAAAAAAGQRQSTSAAAASALSAAAAAGRSFGARASNIMSDLGASAARAAQAGSRNVTSTIQQRHRPQVDPSNTVCGTAHRRQHQQQQHSSIERCPHCHAGFQSVHDLIGHVEALHRNNPAVQQQQQSGVAGTGGEVFVCPRCAVRFSDAVMLVSHNEVCGKAEGKCVLS